MDKYSYTLIRNEDTQKKKGKLYIKQDLELMTTHQLREICRKEKIINGVINPMDKEDLIRVIMRFRGAEEKLLIQKESRPGIDALQNVIGQVKIHFQTDIQPECSSKIVVYRKLALSFYDQITLPYFSKLAGTNALLVTSNNMICGIFNLVSQGENTEQLYLIKSAELPCAESAIKNYSLYCFDKANSEILFRIYNGEYSYIPDHLNAYHVPLLDFEVKEPIKLNMPLAIDFGTSNTTAGVYLDSLYFERIGDQAKQLGLDENSVNYSLFYDVTQNWKETTLLPSVVGVLSIQENMPQYLFGYEAERLADSSYIDEGFCVFYDIKRWIGDYEKTEEIIDRQGHRALVKRSEIIKAYLEYVIENTKNRFKCVVTSVHISSPVKQKYLFQKMFSDILPQYSIEKEDMLDEGVAVLYNTISEMINSQTLIDGKKYKALILDCGGGTTDLSSCTFSVWNRRVSYKIEIETAYENGDTDFGGNNLTYRIMQLLKIELASKLSNILLKTMEQIVKSFDIDVFRSVDDNGSESLYAQLEEEYQKAEKVIPTQFKDYEKLGRADYYKVKNNFYFLFRTAERIKKEFYNKISTLRVILTSEPLTAPAISSVLVDKWKLTIYQNGRLETIKDFPQISCSIFDINALIKADIYGVVKKFMGRMYEEDELYNYSIIKLTGQSCKIELFREALKEFVPGKIIKFKRVSGDLTDDYELKMTCVDGTLKYLKDKKYGYADIHITNNPPALPYTITAFTHTGAEKVLIQCLERNSTSGNISRNMEDLTLKLYLKDTDKRIRYSYTYSCILDEFKRITHEEIQQIYGGKIPQQEVDCIVDREVKFFVWAKPEYWGYLIVPIYRDGEDLKIGREQFYGFENDSWVKNFFDGTK